MKKKSAAVVSNVHGFGSSGVVKTLSVEGGKMMGIPKGKPAPPASHKPVPAKPKIKSSGVKGVKVGEESDPNKWRCAVCKHLNEETEDVCTTCQEPKKVFVPKPQKAGRPLGQHEETKKKPVGKMPDKVKKTVLQKPQPGITNIKTLQDLAPKPEALGAGKVTREWKDTEEQVLKV